MVEPPVPSFDAGERWSASQLHDHFVKACQKADPEDDCELSEPDFWGRDPSDHVILLESFGEVVYSSTRGTYAGDVFALLRSEHRYGLVFIGWGSCTGCDALGLCRSWADVAELHYGIARGIRWFSSSSDALRYVKTHDWSLEWSWPMMQTYQGENAYLRATRIRRSLTKDFKDTGILTDLVTTLEGIK